MMRSGYRLVHRGGCYGVEEVKTYGALKAGGPGVTLLGDIEWCESYETALRLLRSRQAPSAPAVWMPFESRIAEIMEDHE